MDNLVKNIRVRFSGQEDQEETSYTSGERIRPRKTVAFKGDRKRTKSWLERQFSGQMNDVDDPKESEFATAVAAAALAISILEGEGTMNKKGPDEELKRILSKTKSKLDESSEKPAESKIFKWLSGKEAKEDDIKSGESSMKKVASLDQQFPGDSSVDNNVSVKRMGTTSTVKKTSTFSDKHLNDTRNKKTELGQAPRTGQSVPSTMKPRASSSGSGQKVVNKINSSEVETEVEAWKIAKLAKIKRGYEKLMSTILEWESEKKTKAKRRMERKENATTKKDKVNPPSQKEIEERRARVMQEYRNDVSRIDKIAGGARAVADERKRNDEAKTIEKAKESIATGKVSKDCSCF